MLQSRGRTRASDRLQTGDRNGGGGVKRADGDTQLSWLEVDCSSRPVTSFAGSLTELRASILQRAFMCVSARHSGMRFALKT